MITLLTSLLSGPGALFAGLSAALAVVAGVWLKGRRGGAAAERARQRAAVEKARTIADEIDDAVSGRDAERNRKELKRW